MAVPTGTNVKAETTSASDNAPTNALRATAPPEKFLAGCFESYRYFQEGATAAFQFGALAQKSVGRQPAVSGTHGEVSPGFVGGAPGVSPWVQYLAW